MTTASIVVVGSLNMDLVVPVLHAPNAGETLSGRTLLRVPGGKGANQAVACARLSGPQGGKVALVGRIGADDFGVQLRDGLSGDGILLDHVSVDSANSSGVALIVVEDSGENRIIVVPGANGSFEPSHVDAAGELIAGAELLLLQLEVSLAANLRAIDHAARAGKRVLLNPAPAQPLPNELLTRIDYLVPNETEASHLTGVQVVDASSAAVAAFQLLKRGVRHVLITLGAKGVLIADQNGIRAIAAPAVHAVDTTAAGDTFIGALAVALVEGLELDAAARFAVTAASVSVTRMGAQSSIPYRAEISA